MSGHVPNPPLINLTIDGRRIQMTALAAKAFRSSKEDGTLAEYVFPTSADQSSVFTRRGWAIRSRAGYQLTTAGLKVRDALRAYDERKKQALEDRKQ